MTQTHSCTGIDFCWKYINHWNCKIDGVDFFPAQYKWIHWVIRRKITYSGQVSNLFTSKITLKDNCQTSFLSNQNYTYSVETFATEICRFCWIFSWFRWVFRATGSYLARSKLQPSRTDFLYIYSQPFQHKTLSNQTSSQASKLN